MVSFSLCVQSRFEVPDNTRPLVRFNCFWMHAYSLDACSIPVSKALELLAAFSLCTSKPTTPVALTGWRGCIRLHNDMPCPGEMSNLSIIIINFMHLGALRFSFSADTVYSCIKSLQQRAATGSTSLTDEVTQDTLDKLACLVKCAGS